MISVIIKSRPNVNHNCITESNVSPFLAERSPQWF